MEHSLKDAGTYLENPESSANATVFVTFLSSSVPRGVRVVCLLDGVGRSGARRLGASIVTGSAVASLERLVALILLGGGEDVVGATIGAEDRDAGVNFGVGRLPTTGLDARWF